MRYCGLLLICCLGWATPIQAAELFGEFLYWKATEPVDWVLNTNRLPANQYINYEQTVYDFAPGFRVGMSLDGTWNTNLTWTHFRNQTEDTATGKLTAAFLGGKESQPPAPQLYFDRGELEATINYDVIDLDLSRSMEMTNGLRIRPVVGMRAGIIRQSFITSFEASYVSGMTTSQRNIVETAESNFWGIGPKVGIDGEYALLRSSQFEMNLTAGFFVSYLLGDWSLPDETRITQINNGMTSITSQTIQVDSRDFASLSFQSMVGLNVRRGPWSAAVGYEINDWLNQCQIFTDASGPQNNDLLLQGLTANLVWQF
ncbi:hypothetical protein DTL42_13585 [Bremerella cremea]|uniref:Uncharacterized protein n=1 Tax=Bremerella cremea TaxID=1031537 RepID=A0A368KQ78_9BACT|nr:Lpg1974 family pore-forming outer membrane protein [Bremerella cremea]RCS48232.1 hypothetical protein DTL42_13585 [Bremerella cremea]